MLIKNVYLVKDESVGKYDVLINENGIIQDVQKEIVDESDRVIDGDGKLLVPGFIDIHTHGFNKYTSEEDEIGLRNLAIEYAKRGTLAFCPTIGPRTFDEYLKIIEVYKNAFSGEYDGARFLGLHLEGPFLSEEKAGAIDPEKMYNIELKKLEEFLKKSNGYIKTMTIAPEVKNAVEAVELLKKFDIYTSAGHTNCSYDEMNKVSKVGLNRVTHMYNAMKALNHKEPGVIEYVMLNDDIYCELIMDGVHVSMEAIRLLIKNKGIEKIIAISDGGSSCGIDYENGYVFDDGYKIFNGAIYTPDLKTLCGSTRDLLCHFKFIKNELGLSVIEAQKFTSTNASIYIGEKVGKVMVGYIANLLLLDKDFNIVNTIINGKVFNG